MEKEMLLTLSPLKITTFQLISVALGADIRWLGESQDVRCMPHMRFSLLLYVEITAIKYHGHLVFLIMLPSKSHKL